MVPPVSNTHSRQQSQNQVRQQARKRRNESGSASLSSLGLYERSQKQQQDRERKMEALRAEMMEDYTFAPQIGLTAKAISKSTTFTTKSSSSGESVFSRLYRGSPSGSSWSTPQKGPRTGEPRLLLDFHSMSEESSRVTTASSVSRRIEGIYQQGVAKQRAKPLNDQHETLIRIRNSEEKELKEHCTFWPKTHWGQMVKSKQTSTRRSTKLVMQPSPCRIKPQYQPTTKAVVIPDLKDPPLPKEIVVTTMEPNNLRLHPWDSPQRQQLKQSSLQPPVSPLRELSLVQSIINNRKEPPNENSDRTSKKPGVEMKSREGRRKKQSRQKPTQETDYGSI